MPVGIICSTRPLLGFKSVFMSNKVSGDLKACARWLMRTCAPVVLVLGWTGFSVLACPVQRGAQSKTEIGSATVFSGLALFDAPQFSNLTPELLTKIALSCQEDQNATVVKVTIFQKSDFPSIGAAKQWIDPEKSTDVTFSDWLARYEEVRPKPLAQVILIGHGQNKIIVNRILRKGRPVEQTVIDASHILGSDDELLDLAVDGKIDPEAVLYIRRASKTLEVEDAEKLDKRLVKLIGTEKIMVRVRKDSWFIADDSFPIAYPFDAKSHPQHQAEKRGELQYPIPPNANMLGGSITCQGLNRCSVEPRQ